MTNITMRFQDKDSQNMTKEIGALKAEFGSPTSAEERLLNTKQLAKEKRRRDKELSGKNVGHWNIRQKKLYYTFLTLHERHFLKNQLRRSDKVFRSMSHYIGTRAADQCRSHHQKMQKKYKSFENILDAHRNDLEELAKQESPNQSAVTQQSIGSPELIRDLEHGNSFMCNDDRVLFELPSLLMETPISIDHRFSNDLDYWPLRDASNDIEC